jgi:hypothetical protein
MKRFFRNLSFDGLRVRWYLAQLLPLRYLSHYGDSEGRLHFCDWRMWFGQCFFVKDRVVSIHG